MTITALPEAPSTSDPENFDSEADAFVAALSTMVTEFNTDIALLNSISTQSTSTTSNTVGTGSKSFTVQTGKSYFVGMSLTIARTAAPANRMFAYVDSYNSGTGALVVTSQAFEGSGTFTDWSISQSFPAIVEDSRATVAATATTTPVWASNQKVQDWTGTPTITNFPAAPQAGARRTVYPAAGTIFTDNANIDVQGDSNYTVVAGDKVYIEALTTTTFKVFVERKSAQPIFVARNNVSQSVTTSTVTKVTLGTEIYDTNSNFASSRFTPTVAGYYMIDATLRGEATNLTQIISFLYFNGAEYRRGGTINTPAVTGAQTVKISEIIYFNGTTDYVELYGSVTGTTPSFDFISSSTCTVFSGHFIRA
jgi:hypothetical protein